MKTLWTMIRTHSDRQTWLVLIGLVVVALAIRLYQITNLMAFTYDQGRDMYVLQQISRGDIKLVGPTTGLPGVFLGPFYYYALLPGFILSNGSPFGVVIWQMVVITLALPLAYWIMKPLVGHRWAVVAVVALILAPGSIEEARLIWNPSWTVMLVLIAIASLWRSRLQPWWLAVSTLAMSLALQTELAYVIFLAPVFVGWVLARFSWSMKTSAPAGKYSWLVLVVCLGFLGATLVPQGLFELKYRGQITRSIIAEMQDHTKQVSLAKVWQERPTLMAQEMIRTTVGAHGAYQWWFVALLCLWIWTGATQLKSSESKFLWWLFAAPLFGFMLHRGNYGSFFNYYLSPHYALTFLITVFGLARLSAKWRVAPLVALAGIIFLFGLYARVAFNVPLYQYTAQWQIKALLTARQVRTSPETPLEVFVPNLIPVSYQYLSEWLSRTGQAEPMKFGLDGQTEYVLISEPPFSDGSRVAYRQWYEGHHAGATCQPPLSFGITQLELCRR